MTLKKFTLMTALTTVCAVSVAGSFDGPFLQAGLGFAESRTDVNFMDWFTAKPSDNSFIGQISGGYSKSWGRFNLAGSAYYVLGDQKAGRTLQAWSPDQVDSVSMKLKNTWGISIEPGFNISESTLAYVKLGYSQTEGTWSLTRPNDSHTGTPNFHGVSFGVGAKHKFSSNIYGFAEIQQTNFKKKNVLMTVDGLRYTDSFKPESLTYLVGLGYKF